ncbi:hypothetical protein JCM11641_006775 [Rhodosporidiobolus odoratus]
MTLHASLSTTPPSPTRSASSLFSRLPLELLQHILTLVRDQDIAFRESGRKRASACYEDDDEHELTDVREGRWSCWMGRGLAAMAGVSKPFRKLAFPMLLETVTVKQLAVATFRFNLFDYPTVRAAIHHLHFPYPNRRNLCAAAPFLRLLPNLAQITLCDPDDLLELLDEPPPFERVSKARRDEYDSNVLTKAAIMNMFRRVSSVCLVDHDLQQLENVLTHKVNPGLITHLSLSGSSSAFSLAHYQPTIHSALLCLTSLTSLELLDFTAVPHIDDGWLGAELFPSVTRLTILAEQPNAIAPFIQKNAPSVEHLHLRNMGEASSNKEYPLRKLRHLSITGSCDFFSPAFSSSPLLSFMLTAIGHEPLYNNTEHLPEILPSIRKFPPSLRTLIVRETSTCIAPDLAEYRAACASRSIALHYTWTPDTYSMGPELAHVDYDHFGTYSNDAFTVNAAAGARSTLEWALRRLEHAERMADERTVHEVVQSTFRLREMHVLEKQ